MLRQALLGGFCLPIAPVFANPLRDSCQRRDCRELAPDQRPIGGRSAADRTAIVEKLNQVLALDRRFRLVSARFQAALAR